MYGRAFLTNIKGSAATIAALSAVPILLLTFGAIDIMQASGARSTLQAAVDAGALAGAGRLGIVRASGSSGITEVASRVARQTLEEAHDPDQASFEVGVADDGSGVTVTGVAVHKALIGFLTGDQTISATATAENLGSIPLCVLQTGTTAGISLDNTARIRATGCAVHANQNIKVANSAMIQADRTQAVGTISGPVSPAGNAGAMPIPDPFSSLNLLPPAPCVGKTAKIKQAIGTTSFLAPGVHCEEYVIDQGATLVLQPGDHYFMNDLTANNNAVIRGDDVVLIFGTTESVSFGDHAAVVLSARKSGPFSGFLIATTRKNHETFSISSDNVSKLLGTIYIPSATLAVSTTGNVAQDSAWSIIVADNLQLTQSPNLVINNNYAGSGVPVPDGVGPNRNNPVLSH